MRIDVRGIHLNAEVAGRGPALVLLHGFTGSAATWAGVPALGRGRSTIALDLLGHGDSDAPADPARYGFGEAVADVLGVLDRLAVGPAALLGYSLGARLALHLALAAPERFGVLVLEGAAPGLPEPERAARRAADEALAQRIERRGMGAFVAFWERQGLFASQAGLPAESRARLHAQRLANRPAGLAGSLRGMGLGRQEDLLPRLGGLATPTLLVAGALDAKFRGLARVMAGRLPAAATALVAGAGHAAHLERPAEFGAQVDAFLCSHGFPWEQAQRR